MLRKKVRPPGFDFPLLKASLFRSVHVVVYTYINVFRESNCYIESVMMNDAVMLNE
jgi:hypothetical protein